MEAAKRHANMLPLLNRLSREPVVLEFGLADKPISKLADGIDQADLKIEAHTQDELHRERLKASIDRCREGFALLLLEIPPDRMSEIQKQSLQELLGAAGPGPLPVSAGTTNAPPEKLEEQMQLAPAPEPAMPPPATRPASPPPPRPAPRAVPPPPVPPLAAPLAPESPAPVAPAEASSPSAPELPEPSVATQVPASVPLLDSALQLTAEAPTATTGSSIPLSTTPVPIVTTSALATELLQFATLLERNQNQLPQPHLQRLILQHHLMALECECQEKLRPGLKAVWPQRKAALMPYLDPQTQAVSAAVKTFLKQLQTSHPEWIGPFEFSVGWLQVMLRYWLSDTPQESFHPSLAECGFVLCLFGQPSHDGLPFNNLLGIRGLETPKVEELVARLNRLHRYRNQIFNVRERLSEASGKQVREDLAKCFELIQSLECDQGEAAHG